MSHTTTAVLQEEVQDIIDVAKYKKQNAKAYIWHKNERFRNDSVLIL